MRLVLPVGVGLAVIAGLIALDELLFRVLLDRDYLRWYLANGALIAIAFALLTFAWGDLNKLTHLISAHPLAYVASCLELWTLPGFGLAALLRYNREEARLQRRVNDLIVEHQKRLEAVRASGTLHGPLKDKLLETLESHSELAARAEAKEQPPQGLVVVDDVLSLLFASSFVIVYAVWLLVVAPLQYVVNLVAGAPARLALASQHRAWARVTARQVQVDESPKSDDLPEGAVESGFSSKPVAFTAALATALLFTVSKVAT